MEKAVFLDKDGTLIPDIPYNVDPAKISLYADAGAALQRLQATGFRLIIVTNQSGVARGYFPETALADVESRLHQLLREQGVRLDGFLYCPHQPDGSVMAYATDCNCRKPQPGMLLTAARAYAIDLSRSWMIGDIVNDIEAGNRAGCQTILIDRGHETEWLTGPFRTPTATVTSLLDAANFIHEQSRQSEDRLSTARV